MEYSELFAHGRCDRCRQPMTARAMSFFTEEIICMHCLGDEREIIEALRNNGSDPARLIGCGYLPVLHDGTDAPAETERQAYRR